MSIAVSACDKFTRRLRVELKLWPKLLNAIYILLNTGLGRLFHELFDCGYNKYFGQRLGIDNFGGTTLCELRVAGDDFLDYMPLGYYAIRSALKKLPVEPSASIFPYFGCGKGQAVVGRAASQGYKYEVTSPSILRGGK